MSSVYRIGEFADKIGRSTSTVRRWEAEGRIFARRTPSGQRFFTDADVNAVLTPGFGRADRETVVYCRVSSANQRTDLTSQRTAMEQFCLARGLSVDRWITEIGGGMNLTRPRLLALMTDMKAGKVAVLVVAHKDRLARFGFDYLQHEADVAGCEIVVADQESLSPQQEMVQDLLAIVHTFSCRLSGLRRYEQQLKAADLGGEPS
jgi:putative resolvase